MNSGRMKKLAGINEGNTFKNGKFTLDRFDVWATWDGDIAAKLSRDGEWCAADDVAKLEAIAAEMYGIVNDLADIVHGADQMIVAKADVLQKAARKVIEKVKSL